MDCCLQGARDYQPGQSKETSEETNLLRPHGICDTDHPVQPDVCIPLFVLPEALGDGSRVGETGRLKEDVIKRTALRDEFLDRGKAIIPRRTAEAAVGQGQKRAGHGPRAGLDRDGPGFDIGCVAELVHDDGDPSAVLLVEDVPEERRAAS